MPFIEGAASSAKQAAAAYKASSSGSAKKYTSANINVPGVTNFSALNAGGNPGVSSALSLAKDLGVVGTVQAAKDVVAPLVNNVLYGSSGASASPSAFTSSSIGNNAVYTGYSGSGSASSNVASSSKSTKSLEQIINETVDKNNAWSAEQAQKQMDFQERMARNAHQYEVEDLIAAGLNPALSVTGGNGAQAMSGAMAQADTSNTRLLAELSLESLNALGSSAVQLASYSGSSAASTFKDKLIGAATKYFIPALARGAATALTKGIFR